MSGNLQSAIMNVEEYPVKKAIWAYFNDEMLCAEFFWFT